MLRPPVFFINFNLFIFSGGDAPLRGLQQPMNTAATSRNTAATSRN